MTGSMVPVGYADLLADLTAQVRPARTRATRTVNTEMLALYWSIGQTILDRQAAQGWGAKVIDRLADDLQAEFPDMRGLSRSNLKYMRQAAATWPGAIGQQAAGQFAWGHIMVLLDGRSFAADSSGYAQLIDWSLTLGGRFTLGSRGHHVINVSNLSRIVLNH